MTDPLSQAPTRLLDDPSIAASLRGDLQLAAQPALTYNVEAGLARFEGSLAAGATPATAASATLISGRILGWVLGASVLVAGSVGAGQLVEQARAPRTEAGVVIQTPSKIAAVERAQQVRAQHGEVVDSSSLGAGAASAVPGESAAAARSGELAGDASLAPGAERAGGNSPSSDGVAPLRPVSKSSEGASPEPAQPSLADEARQINEARKALKSDPAKALALTEAAAKAFPQGAMVQEREGYAILALAALGRSDEARARADKYLARWPNGTLSKRVQAAVGTN